MQTAMMRVTDVNRTWSNQQHKNDWLEIRTNQKSALVESSK